MPRKYRPGRDAPRTRFLGENRSFDRNCSQTEREQNSGSYSGGPQVYQVSDSDEGFGASRSGYAGVLGFPSSDPLPLGTTFFDPAGNVIGTSIPGPFPNNLAGNAVTITIPGDPFTSHIHTVPDGSFQILGGGSGDSLRDNQRSLLREIWLGTVDEKWVKLSVGSGGRLILQCDGQEIEIDWESLFKPETVGQPEQPGRRLLELGDGHGD